MYKHWEEFIFLWLDANRQFSPLLYAGKGFPAYHINNVKYFEMHSYMEEYLVHP